ncbi:MAG TPA: pteridine-dependent deoxygenase, partial [Candidatus Competibacter sp.]|nr:pteridine-dependent deoxygenase [Candidatus Competibacter sp.]
MFPFQVVYRDETQAARALDDERLLALIRFREPAAPLIDPRSGVIPLPELGGSSTVEVWLSAQPVCAGVTHGVSHAGNDAVLFLQ